MFKNNNKCISIIEPVGGHGGMQFYDYELCKSVAKYGYNVLFFTCDETIELKNNGVEVFRYFHHIYGKNPKSLRAVFFIIHLIRSLIKSKLKSSKIVHYHLFGASVLELLTLYISKFFGFKVVITAHDVESFADKNTNSVIKKVYRLADHIIAHSRIASDEIKNRLVIQPNVNSIIPHGHYINYFSNNSTKTEARLKFDISLNDPVLLFFGQIKKVKGLDVLLKAFPEILEKHPNAKLLVAGKLWKTDFSEYAKIIEQHKMESSIILHNHYIKDEDVEFYFRAADIAVLPYRKIYQSGVLLLGMSAGCPMITSDIEGMKEVIKDGENGFLFENDNFKSLSHKINSLLNNPSLLNNIKIKARAYIEDNHSSEIVGNLTTQVYNSILK